MNHPLSRPDPVAPCPGSNSKVGASWHSSQGSASTVLRRPQQRVQFPRSVQRHEIVAAANVPVINENLRHRGSSAGAAFGLLAGGRAMRGVDLLKSHLLRGQNVDRALAEWAPGLGIDFDIGHLKSPL